MACSSAVVCLRCVVGAVTCLLVARDWRVFAEYHFDYRLATVSPGAPLEATDWMRHSAVLGFSVSPDGYKEAPEGDKIMDVVLPFVFPLAGWTAAAIGKGVAQ